MVGFSIYALDGLHCHVRVVCGLPEQKGAPVYGLNILRHQWMPPDKVQHVVGQGGGHVDAPGSQIVCDTLRTNETRKSTGWRTSSGFKAGSGEKKKSARLEYVFSTSQTMSLHEVSSCVCNSALRAPD